MEGILQYLVNFEISLPPFEIPFVSKYFYLFQFEEANLCLWVWPDCPDS